MAGERLPVGVPRHRDDAVVTQLLRGQDAEQPDGAVTHDRDRFAGARLGGDGGVPAGSEHIGCREQRRHEVRRRFARRLHEGAVGERDAGVLRLGADRAHHHLVHAARLVARLADLAGVVGGDERADDVVTGNDGGHGLPDGLDDADVLVAHALPVRGEGLEAAVRPEVRPADAGRGDADDRVGRLDDDGHLEFFGPDIAGGVHDDSTHGGSPSSNGCFHCAPRVARAGVPAKGCTGRAPFAPPAGATRDLP
jgi:hypothetical protein